MVDSSALPLWLAVTLATPLSRFTSLAIIADALLVLRTVPMFPSTGSWRRRRGHCRGADAKPIALLRLGAYRTAGTGIAPEDAWFRWGRLSGAGRGSDTLSAAWCFMASTGHGWGANRVGRAGFIVADGAGDDRGRVVGCQA